MSLYGLTPSQRVLEIPEIVELIFSFLDAASNANNAVVCKRWSELALNIVWRDVTDVRRLFNVLAPMRIAPLSVRERFYKDCYVRACVLTAAIP